MREVRGAGVNNDDGGVRQRETDMKTHLPIAVGALCAALISATPAFAQAHSVDNYDRVDASQTVSYSDLDLSSERGATRFLSRVREAAEQVCGYDRRDQWTTRREARACVRQAMNNAVYATRSDAVATQYAGAPAPILAAAPAQTVAVASASTVRPVSAQLADETYTTTARVSYADLDLNTERGRTVLERRLNRAAREVCGAAGSTAVRLSAEHRECLNAARTDAQTQFAAITGGTQYAGGVAASPRSSGAVAEATTATPAPPQTINAAASTDGFGVCATRSIDASFAGRSTSLSAAERLNIGYAVDSASVCALDRAVIAANRNDATASRRANALRAAMIARGAPADRVVVEYTDDTSALGSRVQMNFSGVAHTGEGAEVMPAGV
jgi:UrcA family protein